MFPSNWDVVHLCWWHGETPLLRRKTLHAPYQLVKFIYHSWGAAAYLVSRHAAARMLELSRPITFPADHLPQGLKEAGLAIFGIEPTCVNFNKQLAFDPRFNTLSADRLESQVEAGQRPTITIQGEANGWIDRLRLIKRRLDPRWII